MLLDKQRLDSRIPIGAKIDRSRSRMAAEGHSNYLWETQPLARNDVAVKLRGRARYYIKGY